MPKRWRQSGTTARMLKTCQPHRLPQREAGSSSACVRLTHPGRGRRPCHSATLILDQPGATAPGQRPPRARRALLARLVGRWPLSFPDLPVCGALSHAGGGSAVRFLFPPGRAFSQMPGICGRGHRPCHSAALASGPAGGHSPRPAPAPPQAGASRPPGRALASVLLGPAGLQGTVPRGRGKRDAFPVPARTDDSHAPASMEGAIAPATAPCRDQDRPGAKAPGQRPPRPWRALRPRRVGRWPLLFPDLPVCGAPSRRGGGNAGRVSRSRPKGTIPFPGPGRSSRQAGDRIASRHPVKDR